MSNWIDDGHGNKWHRCKLGPDCGLKVIEAGRARCWCQDQEASRCEVQAAREEIAKLEADNERLREEAQRAKIDRDLAGWDDYAVIAELKRENAALREDKERLEYIFWPSGSRRARAKMMKLIGTPGYRDGEGMCAWRAGIDAAMKEAQP